MTCIGPGGFCSSLGWDVGTRGESLGRLWPVGSNGDVAVGKEV